MIYRFSPFNLALDTNLPLSSPLPFLPRAILFYSHLLSLVLSLSLSLSFPSYLFSAASHYKLHHLLSPSFPSYLFSAASHYKLPNLLPSLNPSSPRRVTINYTISSLYLSVSLNLPPLPPRENEHPLYPPGVPQSVFVPLGGHITPTDTPSPTLPTHIPQFTPRPHLTLHITFPHYDQTRMYITHPHPTASHRSS